MQTNSKGVTKEDPMICFKGGINIVLVTIAEMGKNWGSVLKKKEPLVQSTKHI